MPAVLAPPSAPRAGLAHRSRLVQQVINKVMLHGKKSTAETIVYDALAIVGERTGRDPVEVLDEAIEALTPVLEVRSRRVGGATYQVPVEVPARRARTLAVRWLVSFARNRGEKAMADRLARRSWTRPSSRAAPGSARTTSTAWRRPTRPSPTTAGSCGASQPALSRSSVGRHRSRSCRYARFSRPTLRPATCLVFAAFARG